MITSKDISITYDDIEGEYSLKENNSKLSYEFTDFDIARSGIAVILKIQHYFSSRGIYIGLKTITDIVLKEIVKL